jgi:hypothetical protein
MLKNFHHGSASWILGPYIYDIFSGSSQTGTLYCDVFSHSSQINSPFVTFYKIHHGCRPNSPISMDPPIVFYLCGMNISYWSHMSDLHQKIIFLLPKYNTMALWWPTWHISIRVANRSCQHGHWKPLPLGYCWGFVVMWVNVSLYYVLGCWFGPVSIETRVEPAMWQVPMLRNDSNPPISSSCSEMARTHLSVLVAQKCFRPMCQF